VECTRGRDIGRPGRLFRWRVYASARRTGPASVLVVIVAIIVVDVVTVGGVNYCVEAVLQVVVFVFELRDLVE
jgi:hypothetical protein